MDTELENFTQQARHVVTLGQTQARVLGHNYTGTEHLLLGLLQESAGLAAQLLTDAAVTTESVRQDLMRSLSGGNRLATGQLALTPHCRQVLELATNEADLLGQDYVGTEHLLLGLMRLPDCLGAEILLRLCGNLTELRTAVLAALAGPAGMPNSSPP